ncbi:MAG: 16S rRNA (uracil(1498)-N(3))-methyltransferase [Oligoflexales bacterium]
MKHTFRFLGSCNHPSSKNQEWEIAGDEHHHLRKVLKLPENTNVEVFDGKGHSASGKISFLDRSKAVVMASPLHYEREEHENAIALGALKPGFIDELLPSLTELGISSIHVFLTDQTEKSRITDKAVKRWHKIILTAVKQCKRNYLPKIKTWPNMKTMVDQLDELYSESIVLDASGTEPFLNHLNPGTCKSICAIIGGEKGFSHAELALLGARKLRCQKLGSHVLRAYTATIAAASLLSCRSLKPDTH